MSSSVKYKYVYITIYFNSGERNSLRMHFAYSAIISVKSQLLHGHDVLEQLYVSYCKYCATERGKSTVTRNNIIGF